MGFFKDFKRDFAQAVNELIPDKDELANEYDDEDMVNTFDENDNMEIAPEDMLENIDDLAVEFDKPEQQEIAETPDSEYDEEPEEPKDRLDEIPDAEVLSENEINNIDDLGTETDTDDEADKIIAEFDMTQDDEEEDAEDELVQLDELDEENMLENTDDAQKTEPEEQSPEDVMADMDLNQAVMDAMTKQEEDNMADLDVSQEVREETEVGQDISSIMTNDTTYITKGTVLKGNIETDGGIDLIGTIEGDVVCGGKLIVGGNIKGNVSAGEIYANAAKIEGEIITEGSIKIGVGSVVVGNVSATSAVIAGAVNGDIDVHGPVIVDSTAVIMGNIKSRSVQINNGAVIEGFCSQCYSEIDVKSFFE